MIRAKDVVRIKDTLSLYARGAVRMRGVPKHQISIDGEPVPVEKIMREFGVDRPRAEAIQRRLCR